MFQRLILAGEQSGLLTHIRRRKTLHFRTDELLTAFLELESVIRVRGHALCENRGQSPLTLRASKGGD